MNLSCDEIFHIFSFLSEKEDLIKVSLVDSRFYEISKNNLFWRSFLYEKFYLFKNLEGNYRSLYIDLNKNLKKIEKKSKTINIVRIKIYNTKENNL
jgi:hypothetical protein